MSKPGHLEKVLLLHAPILRRNEAFLGIAVLAFSSPDRQRVSTLFRLWRNFFSRTLYALYKSSILWIFFFFFFSIMTILNCRKLQKFLMMWANILDEWENVAKRKDSLDIFPWCPLNCRYEFLELEASVFEIYHHQTKEIGNEFLRQQFLEYLFFRMTHTFWFWFPRQLIGYYCKYFYSSQFVWEQNFSSFKLFSKVFR